MTRNCVECGDARFEDSVIADDRIVTGRYLYSQGESLRGHFLRDPA